jgi:hypothetical protein
MSRNTTSSNHHPVVIATISLLAQAMIRYWYISLLTRATTRQWHFHIMFGRCVLIFRNAPHFKYLGSFEDYGASWMSATRGSPCEPCNDPSEGLRVEVAFDVFDEYYGPRYYRKQHLCRVSYALPSAKYRTLGKAPDSRSERRRVPTLSWRAHLEK